MQQAIKRPVPCRLKRLVCKERRGGRGPAADMANGGQTAWARKRIIGGNDKKTKGWSHVGAEALIDVMSGAVHRQRFR